MMPNEATGEMEPSSNVRSFCGDCGTHLWAHDERWGKWVYPFASAIDAPDLPVPPHTVHIMLGSKASWVVPQVSSFYNNCIPWRKAIISEVYDWKKCQFCYMQVSEGDKTYDEYPELGIEEWHKKNKCYIK